MKKSLSNKNISGTADSRLRGDDGKETTKKKVAFFFSSIPAFFIPAFAFAQTQATLSISSNIPGLAANPANPGAWINGFYTLALMLGGVLAFGAVVYGGVLYASSAGNPSKQSEGKDWILSALLGLLLLAGAYLVLNTINPGLTNIAFPTLSSVGTVGAGSSISGSGAGTNGGSAATTGNATPGTGVTGAVSGLQSVTVTALNDLEQACTQQAGATCSVNVTSGAGGSHIGNASAAGSCTHAAGCKADIAPNASVNAYLTSLPQVTCSTGSCWAPLYQAPDGAIYANELTCPASCNGSCGSGSSCWSGPHWDMAAHK